MFSLRTINPTSSPSTNRDHVVEIEMQDQQQQRQQQQQQQWQQQQVQQWQPEPEPEQPQEEKQQQEKTQRQQTPPPEYTEVTATPPPSYSSDVLYHGTITRTDSDGGRPTTELAPPTYQPHGFRNNAGEHKWGNFDVLYKCPQHCSVAMGVQM